jgi:hypothetical protein
MWTLRFLDQVTDDLGSAKVMPAPSIVLPLQRPLASPAGVGILTTFSQQHGALSINYGK